MKSVATTDTGKFVVRENGVEIAGPFETNAEAWRWLDRRDGEPISRQEKVSEWLNEQWLNDY